MALHQQDDFRVDRLDLLTDPRFESPARGLLEDVEQVSPETGARLHLVPLPDPWDFERVYETLHDFARHYPFRTDEESYLVHITTGSHVAQICLFLLTESRTIPGRLLQTQPPAGRGRGAGSISIIDLDLSRYDQLARRFEREHHEAESLLKSGIATRNPAFNEQIRQLEIVARSSDAPILLTGPTGAGKSQLARQLYELRRSKHQLEGPLIEVNCATLRGEQAMSALFGHRRGAFTGATHDRPGLLRSADRGMLFLDEIGELGADEQAMLLRAVEDGRFLPVGSDREVESRFQLVAGTNRDLHSAAASGQFRADLLARIDLWTFRLPGLRERLEDLEPNLDFELDRFGQSQGRRVTFQREARERYLEFATGPGATWAGNFRDLNASVVRMCTLAPGGRIDREGVEAEIARLRAAWRSAPRRHPWSASLLGEGAEELDLFDRATLEIVLEVCRESRSLSAAGRTLFAASRRAKQRPNDADRLRKYLARFRLDWKTLREQFDGSDPT